jgi:hypothetical protein
MAQMPPLPTSTQLKFEETFFKLLQRVHVTAKRRRKGVIDEVDWIEKFHALGGVDLEVDLRQVLRPLALSVAVNSALLHGKPFQAWPKWSHTSARSIEIGDLLLIGEYHGEKGFVQREALLLQMKVGTPAVSPSAAIRGTNAQGEFYAQWPSFNWSGKLRRTLPNPFPRKPEPESRSAARFAIIPEDDSCLWSSYKAYQVEPGPRLGAEELVQVLMARIVRLSLGIDAAPVPAMSRGWPRIVQDILDVAPLYTFRGQQRYRTREGMGRVPSEVGGAHKPRAGFAIVQVGIGPQGRFD